MTFIEKAKKIHGDKYDYSLANYINCKTKVKIICPIHGIFEQTPDKHINGKCGCKKCASESLRKARQNKDFVQKAKEEYGELYDYSLTNYVNLRTKIKIKCNKCGNVFEVYPENHLKKKSGCPTCNKKKPRIKSNLNDFIQKAKAVHGDRYDYSLVEYKNSRTKIKIICKEHGVFEQTPGNHLLGAGCPKCNGGFRFTTEEFIKQAKEVHGNRYNYSLVNYINSKTKVKIICKKHGIFEQTPASHILQKGGCPKCATEETARKQAFTTEKFIERANKVHSNKYDYSLVSYSNAHSKVKIICKEHGVFEQLAYCHLNGSGCPYCASSKGEKLIRNYLLNKSIIFEEQKTFSDLKDKNYLSYDFYVPKRNILIEFNGIQHYVWQKYLQPTYHDFLVQKHHDWLKRKYAKKNNIELVVITYEDDISETLDKYFQ